MNTAELCPRARELYAIWKAWHERAFATYLMQYDKQRIRAWQQYREHVDSCDMCNRKDGE